MKQEYIDALKLIICGFQYSQVELEPEELIQLIRHLDGFDEFCAEDVIEGIKGIDQLIPKARFHPHSPSHGESHHNYIVGQEREVFVIYLVIHKIYMPESFDYLELIQSLRKISEVMGATGYSPAQSPEEDEGRFLYKIWWN